MLFYRLGNMAKASLSTKAQAWIWVPLTNVCEGLPYAIVNIVLVAMLADLKVDAGITVLVTGLCALPWSIKALWSPLVEAVGTRHGWMTWMLGLEVCLILGLNVALFAFNLPIVASLAILFGISAATYDIACDGYYMRMLSSSHQAFFVGIRTTAYRIGMLLASGGAVAFCGFCLERGHTIQSAWQTTLAALLFILVVSMQYGIRDESIPRDAKDESSAHCNPFITYKKAVSTFFSNRTWRQTVFMFAFLLFYRLGESLLSKVTILFLKDNSVNGGLALNNEQYGLLYGTCGMLALIAGGILGGMAISKFGLKRCIIPMALAVNIPDLLYVWLSFTQQCNLWVVGSCISIEQFGYGFGLAAYTVYLLQCSKGEHETAHYAFLTAIMGLSLMLPSTISGFLQQWLGYTEFFWVASLATIPGILLACVLAGQRGYDE